MHISNYLIYIYIYITLCVYIYMHTPGSLNVFATTDKDSIAKET